MTKSKVESKQNNATRQIVRIGVGVVLLGLVGLAFMDRSAKNAATTTTTAWQDALQAATDGNEELLFSDLSQYVSGSPESTGDPSQGSVVYVWSGTFRTYQTTITCDGQDQPVVLRIEGPAS